MTTEPMAPMGEGGEPSLVRVTFTKERFAAPLLFPDCREMTLLSCIFAGADTLPRLADSLLTDCVWEESAAGALRLATCLTLRGGVLRAQDVLSYGEGITVDGVTVLATDFALGCREVTMREVSVMGARAFRAVTALRCENSEIGGDRAFEGMTDASIDFSTVTGADALWGARNVTVTDSVIDGDRFGYFSTGLRLSGCLITGRAPLRFARELTFDGCKFADGAEAPL